MMNDERDNRSANAIGADFLDAVESNDLVRQYELLTAATADERVAAAILEVLPKVGEPVGETSLGAINWRAIQARADRLHRVRRVIDALTSPRGISTRTWTAVLVVLTATFGIASALLFRDGLELAVSDPLFRGTLFLAVFFAGMAILSGSAVITTQVGTLPSAQSRGFADRHGVLWLILQGVLIKGGVAVAAAALLLLTVFGLPALHGTGPVLTRQASPGSPVTLELQPRPGGSVKVSAKDSYARILLRIVDSHGVEQRFSFTGTSSWVPLHGDQLQSLKAEILTDEKTVVMISTRGVTSVQVD